MLEAVVRCHQSFRESIQQQPRVTEKEAIERGVASSPIIRLPFVNNREARAALIFFSALILPALSIAAVRRFAQPWLVTSAISHVAVFSGLSTPASALTVQQTFSSTLALNPIPAGTGSKVAPAVQFNVQPFAPALGTLNSAPIEWLSSGSAALATTSSSGRFGFSFGGSVNVNTTSHDGYGNGGGSGRGPFSTFSPTIAPTGTKKVLTQA
jgi:hypothetical protein